jgi:ribosomal protein S18 acetylase RimI-like enzyme
MNIRKFNPDDAEEVSKVIGRSLAIVNSKDYPEDHIAFMIQYFSPETVLNLAQERQMFVATVDSKIVGTGSLQIDTIYTLFVDPDYIGRGIGTKLMQNLEQLAKNQHVGLLKVPSSITAKAFYARLGFMEDNEAPPQESGFTIPMIKRI